MDRGQLRIYQHLTLSAHAHLDAASLVLGSINWFQFEMEQNVIRLNLFHSIGLCSIDITYC